MRGIIIFMILLIGSAIFCQNPARNDVPAKVKTKLTKLYPDAGQAKWHKENKNYEAQFVKDKSRITILIDSIGNLIETAITTKVLPEDVRNYLSRSFDDGKIKEAEKVIDANGKVSYKVKINSDILTFRETGKPEKK